MVRIYASRAQQLCGDSDALQCALGSRPNDLYPPVKPPSTPLGYDAEGSSRSLGMSLSTNPGKARSNFPSDRQSFADPIGRRDESMMWCRRQGAACPAAFDSKPVVWVVGCPVM